MKITLFLNGMATNLSLMEIKVHNTEKTVCFKILAATFTRSQAN